MRHLASDRRGALLSSSCGHLCSSLLEIQSPLTASSGGLLQLLASASYDDTIKLYAADPYDDEWQCIHTLASHSATVWTLAFSPCGRYLASAGDDLVIKLWERVSLSTRTKDLGELGEAQRQEGGRMGPWTPGGVRIGIKEKWKWEERGQIEGLHDRTIYAVDWKEGGVPSSQGGLGRIVSAGGGERARNRLEPTLATGWGWPLTTRTLVRRADGRINVIQMVRPRVLVFSSFSRCHARRRADLLPHTARTVNRGVKGSRRVIRSVYSSSSRLDHDANRPVARNGRRSSGVDGRCVAPIPPFGPSALARRADRRRSRRLGREPRLVVYPLSRSRRRETPRPRRRGRRPGSGSEWCDSRGGQGPEVGRDARHVCERRG